MGDGVSQVAVAVCPWWEWWGWLSNLLPCNTPAPHSLEPKAAWQPLQALEAAHSQQDGPTCREGAPKLKELLPGPGWSASLYTVLSPQFSPRRSMAFLYPRRNNCLRSTAQLTKVNQSWLQGLHRFSSQQQSDEPQTSSARSPGTGS